MSDRRKIKGQMMAAHFHTKITRFKRKELFLRNVTSSKRKADAFQIVP